MEKEELIAALEPLLEQLPGLVEKLTATVEGLGLFDNPWGWIILLAIASPLLKFLGSAISGMLKLIGGFLDFIITVVCLPWQGVKFFLHLRKHQQARREKDPLGEYQEMEFGDDYKDMEIEGRMIPDKPIKAKVKKTIPDDDLATSLKRNLLDD